MYFNHTTPELIFWQQKTLPKGYSMVTEGNIQEGDIRWDFLLNEWNMKDITTSPKHNIIIGDNVKDFNGVCRKG